MKFDHSTINRFYKLLDIDIDKYSTYMNEELILETVLEAWEIKSLMDYARR